MSKRIIFMSIILVATACGDDAAQGVWTPPASGDDGGASLLDDAGRPLGDAGRSIDAAVPDAAPPVDSSGYPVDDPNAPNTNALSADLAKNLTLTEVAAYQSLKVSLGKDGAPSARATWPNVWGTESATVPIVAGRDALLRIFVTPQAGYTPATITARVKVQIHGTSRLETHVFYGTKNVTAASTDGDLASTINVTIPGAALQPNATFGVVLNAPGSTPPPTGASDARYPRDGSLATIGASAGGDVMKIVLVPLKYNGDGSGRLPDTSAAQVAMYKDQLFRKYPVARVDVSVRAPVDYNSVVSHDNGSGDVLNFTTSVRDGDHVPSDVYYVGLLKPADNFWDYCGSGCVAGLSWVGAPISMWWGYSGTDWSGGTGAHEVGHAHGLPHAPCGTDDPDWWPPGAEHASAKLGAWGWDPIDQKLFDPSGDPSAKTTYRDMMSYCGPIWIGDFNYAKIWRQMKKDNGVTTMKLAGAPQTMRGVVMRGGSATWEDHDVEWQSWMQNGEPRTVSVVAADGTEASATGYFFAYDHLPGGRLLVPAQPLARARALRVGSVRVDVRRVSRD